jgi:hypothetical protein
LVDWGRCKRREKVAARFAILTKEPGEDYTCEAIGIREVDIESDNEANGDSRTGDPSAER